MQPRRELHAYERSYLESVWESLSPLTDSERREAVEYARNLLENDYPPLFDLGHLAFVTGLEPVLIRGILNERGAQYDSFRLRKRGGGSRLIEAPRGELKDIQRWLQRHLTSRLPVHPAAHGFRPGRSIVTNASPHVAERLIVKMDLRDFFPSVSSGTVFRILRRAGYTLEVANAIGQLTTLNGALPQGAPTSPDLANVAAYRLDARLQGLAQTHGLNYTRYADDLTFSGDALRRPQIRRTIGSIIRDSGFRPNEPKTKYLPPSKQQRVTGIVVNERPTWPRVTRRWLRQEVHFVCRFGVEQHIDRRGYRHANYKDFLYGHLYAMHQVHPVEAAEHLDALREVDWPY